MRATYDCEVYRNYFLITFLYEDGTTDYYNRYVDDAGNIFENKPFMTVGMMFLGHINISFNGRNYDDHIVASFLNGADNYSLYCLSKELILGDLTTYAIALKYKYTSISSAWGIKENGFNFIDIMQVLPLQASLKLYGARINFPKLQELPIHFDNFVTKDECAVLRGYCLNDCEVTMALYRHIEPQIDLRIQMGYQFTSHDGSWEDYRSLSDAQIAEKIYKEEYQRVTGERVMWSARREKSGYTIGYTPYPRIKFNPESQLSAFMCELKAARFNVNDGYTLENNEILLAPNPKDLKTRKPREITVGDKQYKVGLGGLHSVDKPGTYYATDDYELIDIDVAAYYPNIILNSGIEPPFYTGMFQDVYRRLVDMRVEAKKTDKVMDAGLKITINGTFGKLGNGFSKLFAPDLLLHVTLTGQLCLLMLIELFADKHFRVISANTDGITVRVLKSRKNLLVSCVQAWEKQTGFNMEYTNYQSVHIRDVNNYIAIKTDGTAKRKGAYASASIGKNPVAQVCVEAVVAYLLRGTPIDWFIESHNTMGDFVTVRTCRAGASWKDEPIGKALRWYYSVDGAPLLSNKNNNKVAKSDGCAPMMNLSKHIPDDLDYDYYIKEANKMLDQMGVYL